MLIRTKSNSDISLTVNADIEEYFTAASGNSTIIPLGYDWTTVGIQVSGGLDSALLLYLTAIAIKKNGLKTRIQPISVFIPTKAKNIASVEKIVDAVRKLSGVDFINDVMVFDMPMEETSTHDGRKDKFFVESMRSMFRNKIIQFEYNGNTKNPPEEIRQHFKNDEFRQKNRDNASSIYNTPDSASPHYMMDKSDIINLYVQHDLLEDLAPLTVSCDENVSVITELQSPVPCGTCWWCRERAFGFAANNVEDPAPILTFEEYSKLKR